jgi:hypothetical protein
VLRLVRREAESALRQAVECFERKEKVLTLGRTQARLEGLASP